MDFRYLLFTTLLLTMALPESGMCHTDARTSLAVPFRQSDMGGTSALSAVVQRFAEVQAISLRQAWLEKPEPDLEATEVRVQWDADGLYVLARMEDQSIYSSSTDFNQLLWELGDVFEVFIQLDEADAYYEFHVSPNNHVMQLCFDVDLTPEERRLQFPESFIDGKMIDSQTWLNAAEDNWYAYLAIPASVLKPSGVLQSGDTFEFNFCRYDANRMNEALVLSSSSHLRELDFHRRQDWGRLRLESPDGDLEIEARVSEFAFE